VARGVLSGQFALLPGHDAGSKQSEFFGSRQISPFFLKGLSGHVTLTPSQSADEAQSPLAHGSVFVFF
jgi:hypothetical protein